MERFLMEIGGLAFVASMSFAIANFYHLSPIDRSWSASKNQAVFIAIPTLVYLTSRIYMGVSFMVIYKLLSSRLAIARLFSAIVFFGGVFGAFKVIPGAPQATVQLFEEVVGDIPALVLRAGEADITKAKELSYKIFLLLSGWFVLLFSVELVLRVLLLVGWVFVAIITGKGLSRSPNARTDSESINGNGEDKGTGIDDGKSSQTAGSGSGSASNLPTTPGGKAGKQVRLPSTPTSSTPQSSSSSSAGSKKAPRASKSGTAPAVDDL